MRTGYRTVSRAFREQIEAVYPGLGNNRAYWHLLEWLLFSSFRDKERGVLLVPRTLLAEFEGKSLQLENGEHYCGWQFLERFSADVQTIQYSTWNALKNEARGIYPVEWPQAVVEALHDEKRQRHRKDSERVVFTTGRKPNPKIISDERDRIREAALHTLRDIGCEEAFRLMAYLNNSKPHRYTKALQHLEDAIQVADRLPKDSERQLSILHGMVDQAQPFYQAVERSVRLYPFEDSLLTLQRDVRRALTKDWVECDLRSAHLAIAAHLWDIPEVTAFLRTGESVWETLFEAMGLTAAERRPEMKDCMKDALYALLFGGSRKKVLDTFTQELVWREAHWEAFWNHPLIRAVYRARNKEIRRLFGVGYATDVFGNVYTKDRFDCLSILAQVCQAMELYLLWPVVELALEHKDDKHGFCILLWQHDGFSFDVFDPRDRDYWVKRLSDAVRRRCEEIGIETQLVVQS